MSSCPQQFCFWEARMNTLLWRRGPSHLIARSACAPSPPSSFFSLSPFLGGEGRGEGVSPRVTCLWKHPSPRPSPRKRGERERRRRAICTALLLLAACALPSLTSAPARAQAYPTKPVVI